MGGHFPDAITIHSAARRAASRTGNRAAEATAHTNLGLVDWWQGRYRQAAGHHCNALQISREIDDRHGEAMALSNLGIVYERQGRPDQAAHRYGLAYAYHVTGDHGRARYHWKHALGLSDVLGAHEADDIRRVERFLAELNCR